MAKLANWPRILRFLKKRFPAAAFAGGDSLII
jgi:hypothetical protein